MASVSSACKSADVCVCVCVCRLYEVVQNPKTLSLVQNLPHIGPIIKRHNENHSVNIPATHFSSFFKTKFCVVVMEITALLGAECVAICSSFPYHIFVYSAFTFVPAIL